MGPSLHIAFTHGNELQRLPVIGTELWIGNSVRRTGRRAVTRLKHVMVITNVGTELPHLLDLNDVVVG